MKEIEKDKVEELLRRICTDTRAYDIILIHSRLVAEKAMQIAMQNKHLELDMQFIYEAALLHDIGIIQCDAPEIFCVGHEPYIKHGVIGHTILLQQGLPRHARVCLTHTGISKHEIIKQNLPLPQEDLLPKTAEEKIIYLADKFYTKKPQQLTRELPLEEVRRKLAATSRESVVFFEAVYHELYRNCRQ